MNDNSECRKQGKKNYYDLDPNGIRQVLDKTIPYVTVTKLKPETGKWESHGYLAWAKNGHTIRVMIVEPER